MGVSVTVVVVSRNSEAGGTRPVFQPLIGGCAKCRRGQLQAGPSAIVLGNQANYLAGKLRQVEAIRRHDLVPSGDEVVDELRLCVVASVHLGKGAQLGVRTEDEVNA